MYKITKRFIALWLSGVPFKIQACVEIHFNSYSEYSIFANFHLVLVKLMCPALSVPRVFDWAVEVIWIWHLKNTASRSPIKHFFRYVGPADWADAHVWCPYLFDVHILVVISNTLITWSKTNETIHVDRCFPMPGFNTIAYFVSDALNFSLFDHDAFLCEFHVIKPSALTSLSHRHIRKKSFPS